MAKKHISVEATRTRRGNGDTVLEAWVTFKMDESDIGIQWKPPVNIVKEYIPLMTGWDWQKEKDQERNIMETYLDTLEVVDPREEGAVTYHAVIIEPDTN